MCANQAKVITNIEVRQEKDDGMKEMFIGFTNSILSQGQSNWGSLVQKLACERNLCTLDV